MTKATRPASLRPPPTSSSEDQDVQSFLDRLGRLLTAGDAKTLATMWAVPAYVLGDTMTQAVSTRGGVEKFFTGAKEEYNKRGIVDTRPDVFGLEWITDRLVVVDVRWPYVDGRGNEIGEEASTYVLRRDDNGELKLHIALMRGEQ